MVSTTKSKQRRQITARRWLSHSLANTGKYHEVAEILEEIGVDTVKKSVLFDLYKQSNKKENP